MLGKNVGPLPQGSRSTEKTRRYQNWNETAQRPGILVLLRAERGAEIAILGGVGVQVRDVCNENCEERSKREKCEERE